MCNSRVYVKIGASILLCVVAAFVFLLWPVSDERWKRAAVVLENRYCHAMVCQGDTLYFTDVSSHNGLQGESFRSAPCERSQMGLGYFRWPWGGIVGQSEVMNRPIQMQWLEQNSKFIVEKTLERVALHQQTMEEVLKEFEYYNSTHMKDDDGWFEMKYLHEQRLQEKARLDSLKVFLEKAKQYKPSWHYIFKLNAYVPDDLEPLPCGNVWELGKSIYTSLQGNMPDNSTSLLSLAFDWDDMVIPTDFVPEDTVNRHVGILRLEGGGTYKGMMRGTTPDGVGTMSFADGRKYYGGFEDGNMVGNGEMRHPHGLHMAGEWVEDHLMSGRLAFADGGRYEGSLLNDSLPDGAGDYFYPDGSVYLGTWEGGVREGFGMFVGAGSPALVGTWQGDKFQGERLLYTENRVYGIDIARYQHLNRRRGPANIAWKYLRITSLGSYSRKRIKDEKVNYPISFVYVKCTEGVTVLNKHYQSDDKQIRDLGIHVGAYHFFQNTPVEEQLDWFLRNVHYEKGDLPPVLDIEPTDKQIKQKWGSEKKMFSEALMWLKGVEEALGVKPILYVNQTFLNKHLSKADPELQNYDLWVARYGEFKPYTHMIYWQLSPDGKVSGIQSNVDINVFNGSKEKFNEYLQSLQ